MTFTLEDQKYETIESFMENFSNEVDRSTVLECLFDGGNCELYQNLYNHVKHFFSKFNQIHWKLRSWSHLPKKSLCSHVSIKILTIVLWKPLSGLIIMYKYVLCVLEAIYTLNSRFSVLRNLG